MLKQKHVEASRELRLWLTQVILPTVIGGVILYSNSEKVREFVDEKVYNAKNKFKKRVGK